MLRIFSNWLEIIIPHKVFVAIAAATSINETSGESQHRWQSSLGGTCTIQFSLDACTNIGDERWKGHHFARTLSLCPVSFTPFGYPKLIDCSWQCNPHYIFKPIDENIRKQAKKNMVLMTPSYDSRLSYERYKYIFSRKTGKKILIPQGSNVDRGVRLSGEEKGVSYIGTV